MISVLFMGILPGGGLLLYEYMVYERHENSKIFSEAFIVKDFTVYFRYWISGRP